MLEFKQMIALQNKRFAENILSPLTITLGDEFQGIVADLPTCVQIIMALDEYTYIKNVGFKLRYSLHYGAIDTPINHKVAHGMVGAGLTQARENISLLKKDRNRRFWIAIASPVFDKILNNLFVVYQTMIDSWKLDDAVLIDAFLKYVDYKEVAKKTKKDVSLVWRRKKSLQIHEYLSLKEAILESTLLK
jgi:hypothetical protein